jgi:hypothetical protein
MLESQPLKEVWRRLRVWGSSAATRSQWGSIEERVKVDHVARHVVGPFEDLWSDVD